MSAGGGCDDAVTVTAGSGWVKHRECRELQYGRRFHVKLIGAANKHFARPALQYGCEAWCLKEILKLYKDKG